VHGHEVGVSVVAVFLLGHVDFQDGARLGSHDDFDLLGAPAERVDALLRLEETVGRDVAQLRLVEGQKEDVAGDRDHADDVVQRRELEMGDGFLMDLQRLDQPDAGVRDLQKPDDSVREAHREN